MLASLCDNYPHDKALSDLDVLIPSGAGDSDYMKILAETLEELWGEFSLTWWLMAWLIWKTLHELKFKNTIAVQTSNDKPYVTQDVYSIYEGRIKTDLYKPKTKRLSGV